MTSEVEADCQSHMGVSLASEIPSVLACLMRERGLCGLTDVVDLRNAVGRTFGVSAQAHYGRGCTPVVSRH